MLSIGGKERINPISAVFVARLMGTGFISQGYAGNGSKAYYHLRGDPSA
jgi:hypothetical protein